jgi:dihydrofolate reductase
MGRIVVVNNLTLDGVMQAPGRPDEDTRDGFEHGGWAIPYNDEVMGRVMSERMADPGPLLLGRRTYEDFFSYWPHQTDNPFTDVLDNVHKYVVSSILREPLPWQNSTLIDGDVVEAVAELKAGSGQNIGVLGSGELLRTLIPAGLVDEYVLLIHPLILGRGRRMFSAGAGHAALELVDSVPTTTGVVIATYRPA